VDISVMFLSAGTMFGVVIRLGLSGLIFDFQQLQRSFSSSKVLTVTGTVPAAFFIGTGFIPSGVK
jgi:hypothetical protein